MPSLKKAGLNNATRPTKGLTCHPERSEGSCQIDDKSPILRKISSDWPQYFLPSLRGAQRRSNLAFRGQTVSTLQITKKFSKCRGRLPCRPEVVSQCNRRETMAGLPYKRCRVQKRNPVGTMSRPTIDLIETHPPVAPSPIPFRSATGIFDLRPMYELEAVNITKSPGGLRNSA
jgi:hypothetical protein